MTRTYRHLLLSVLWLLGFAVFVVLASYQMDLTNRARNQFVGQLGSIVWVMGFVAIFFSWARVDAVEHGKSKTSAVVFAILWPFVVGIVHLAYLFYTRGFRGGLLASIRFICFCLAALIALVMLAKLWGLFMP